MMTLHPYDYQYLVTFRMLSGTYTTYLTLNYTHKIMNYNTDCVANNVKYNSATTESQIVSL